ncbi:MAG TPA: trypsin-like peptidase domain-containing protein [Candidatus Dormibacteraeota bacterium]|nr:trypsin-like peptidase domain-containing protein [Candidatus Dormibacteraeota bacterium]
MAKETTKNQTANEDGLPYPVAKKIVTLSLFFGVLGGLVGGYVMVKYAPIAGIKQVLLQENSATVQVAKKVSPSVVSITSETSIRSFFGTSSTQQGAGTGVILSADGLILTNKHVVPEGASSFSVFTSDGKEYKDAKVIARDSQNDLAFIRISANGLTPAELGDSGSVQVGQTVIAIGNALGQFENTVTKGVISAIGRPVVAGDGEGGQQEQLQNLIQTDAAINPGNSGGPLVNISGQVVGINTAVAGEAENIGFAIPINEAKQAYESLKSRGKIVRPYLGVRYMPITKELAASNSLPVSEGAYVTAGGEELAVIPGSPASKVGLREGDIIVKVVGKKVDNNNTLSSLISRRRVGEKVALTILRDGKELTIGATLEESPG